MKDHYSHHVFFLKKGAFLHGQDIQSIVLKKISPVKLTLVRVFGMPGPDFNYKLPDESFFGNIYFTRFHHFLRGG